LHVVEAEDLEVPPDQLVARLQAPRTTKIDSQGVAEGRFRVIGEMSKDFSDATAFPAPIFAQQNDLSTFSNPIRDIPGTGVFFSPLNCVSNSYIFGGIDLSISGFIELPNGAADRATLYAGKSKNIRLN